MLTIKKIFDKAVQEKTCKACSIEYDPEQFAYSGYEEEKLIACAQFGIGPFSEKESEIKVHDKIDLKKQKISENGELFEKSALDSFLDTASAYISDLRNADGVSDMEALIIMGKSILYYFYYSCGIKRVFFLQSGDDYDRLARILGFSPDDEDRWFCDTEKLFNTPCEGKCISLNDN